MCFELSEWHSLGLGLDSGRLASRGEEEEF